MQVIGWLSNNYRCDRLLCSLASNLIDMASSHRLSFNLFKANWWEIGAVATLPSADEAISWRKLIAFIKLQPFPCDHLTISDNYRWFDPPPQLTFIGPFNLIDFAIKITQPQPSRSWLVVLIKQVFNPVPIKSTSHNETIDSTGTDMKLIHSFSTSIRQFFFVCG